MASFSVYLTNHNAQSLGYVSSCVIVESATAAGAAAKYLYHPELGHIVTQVLRGKNERLIGFGPGGIGL